MFPRICWPSSNCLIFISGLAFVGLLIVSYNLTNIGNDPHIFSLKNGWPEPEVCQPKRNIVFLKTHKTAGSSIQNIFMRYANRHHLLLLLPMIGNYLGHPRHFDASMVPELRHPNLYRYNVLTHHARFRYDSMRTIMPPDTIFVTILRDPVTMFESLYAYYLLNNTYRMDINVYATANKSMLQHHNRRFYKRIGRNQMSFDLGMSRMEFDDDAAIARKIDRLDSQFDLVMIAERMTESLVLLKRLLCWTTDDVIAFDHNVRMNDNRRTLDDHVEDGLRTWNAADNLLYSHFYSSLLEKMTTFGKQRLANEVDELNRRTKYWYNHCIEDKVVGSKLNGQYRAYNGQVLSFRLKHRARNDVTCVDLAKAELPFTAEMSRKQRKFIRVENFTFKLDKSGSFN